GKYITNPDAFGLDFAITAMFIFLAVSQFDAIKQSQFKTYLVLIVCVIILMLILSFFMPSYVAIILASTITAGLGVVIDK
ncbi:branched-chain amino acid ABC transporter permease, partial [Mesorhizobium sp. M2D.F.Ca.ET.153.01.1.1]